MSCVVTEHPQPGRRRSSPLRLVSPFLLPAICLLCLWHPRSATPWRDLDLFSGTYLIMSAAASLIESRIMRALVERRESLHEAMGLTFDPHTVRWAMLLSLADVLVFLDYAHFHLLPALRRPTFQTAGLFLYVAALTSLIWTDTCLVRHFRRQSPPRSIITDGPFALVRHPRYASMVMVKVGFGLLFASVIGWVVVLASVLLVRRRIKLEEIHLRAIFGDDYASYTEHTAHRLVPGIY